jgi:hypothetical protein
MVGILSISQGRAESTSVTCITSSRVGQMHRACAWLTLGSTLQPATSLNTCTCSSMHFLHSVWVNHLSKCKKHCARMLPLIEHVRPYGQVGLHSCANRDTAQAWCAVFVICHVQWYTAPIRCVLSLICIMYNYLLSIARTKHVVLPDPLCACYPKHRTDASLLLHITTFSLSCNKL